MDFQPFSWGANGQKASPSSVKKQAEIAAALAARGGVPQSLGEGLNRVGEALLSNSMSSRAEAGEADGAAARKAVLDALLANPDPTMTDIAGAMGNEWVAADPGSQAVVQALMGQENQQQSWARQDQLTADEREYNAPLRDLQLQQGQSQLDMLPLDQEYKRAQIDALSAKPAVPPTDDMREYDMAKSQGFTGSLQDWLAVKPSASNVTVNTGDNSSAFGKKADELAATRLGDVVTSGQGASTMMGDIEALAALGPQIGTGKGAEVVATLGPYAQALGIDIANLGEAQAYKSIIDRMAPAMRPVGSGSSSDTDVRMFLNSLPALGKTPEGNQIVLQTLTALQEHKLAAAEIAGLSFAAPENGGITWQEAEKRIRELPNPYQGYNEYKKRGDAATSAIGAQSDATKTDFDYTAPTPPSGWGGDPELWQFMDPEARALW